MRIGMVGARFAGLDGVSLESAKLADALARSGHEISWFAGELGPTFTPSMACDEAAFTAETNRSIERLAFTGGDPEEVRRLVEGTASVIGQAFRDFLDDLDADAVIVENAWAIPMHLPLAVAIAQVVEERGITTVGHHHDFSWERERFSGCVVPDLIRTFFPPALESVGHVVINSLAQRDLLERRGIESLVLPNVMDFESGPPAGDGGRSFRARVGVGADVPILLQPTRVIPRKGIELTIELAAAMERPPVVVVTHPDDLDSSYWRNLTDQAAASGVDLRLVDAGRDIDALMSAYEAADLVCFPSLYEGYGNALVEAIYHRRPVMVNRYSVYVADIAPLGFEFVEIDGSITAATVAAANAVVSKSSSVDPVVERNFSIARAELSYSKARSVIEEGLGIITGV